MQKEAGGRRPGGPASSTDVDFEIALALAELQGTGKVMIVMDGARYRLRYEFNGVNIDSAVWNPGTYVRSLAQYSENLRNVKGVLGFFAAHYGPTQPGL